MTSTIDPTEVLAQDARGRVRVSRERRADLRDGPLRESAVIRL